MKFKAKNWDFICTKGSEKGLYHLMIYNDTTKELYLEEDISEEYISGYDSYGEPYTASKISGKLFEIIYNKLFRKYGSCEGFFNDWEEIEDYIKSKQKTQKVPKEVVVKGLKCELTEDELDKIVQVDVEPADYYDYDAFIAGINKFLSGEITRSYYKSWLILACWALLANKFTEGSKRRLLYGHLSYAFDGHAFEALEEGKEKECNEMLAIVKFNNHELNNVKKSVLPPFYNDDKTIVYVHFEFCNQNNEFYHVCIANENEKVFKIALVANIKYLPNVNYTFIDEDEMLELSNKYYDYRFDATIDENKYFKFIPLKD